MQSPSPSGQNSKHSDTKNISGLNLQGTSCPMAFVKARLYLDQKYNGDVIEILYDNTAANEPLIRSIQSLGHTIISHTKRIEPSVTTTQHNNLNPHSARKIQLNKAIIQVKK
ncbi:MAG: sulfurtransferase TusA family protein [Kordiimonadaceae bacterium]|nr:sulfurtransferase TusA family protein [Kordiimonadaceae bacterium]